jgi:hypothetical protein
MRTAVLAALCAACSADTPAARPAQGPHPAQPASPTGRGDITSANDSCASDDECLVTNFAGCCACPQCAVGPPIARSRSAEHVAEAACAAASCSMGMCNLAGACPPGETGDHFAAHCRAGVCIGVRR